jgi:hypothetical protein
LRGEWRVIIEAASGRIPGFVDTGLSCMSTMSQAAILQGAMKQQLDPDAACGDFGAVMEALTGFGLSGDRNGSSMDGGYAVEHL